VSSHAGDCPRRLSTSTLWAAQRRFYEREGLDAWRTGVVPHHVTSNVALATAYARVVLGFVRDTTPRAPLHVIELGAGCGRFAFLFLRALDDLAPGAPIRYVMTDVAASSIAGWRSHAALRPFVRAGRLDFARFDADADDRVRLLRARRTIAADAPASRLAVIANYVFSGLRQDAFAVRAGGVREYHVAAGWPRGRRLPADVALRGRLGPPVNAPYEDPGLDAMLGEYAAPGAEGRFLFPIGPIRCLARLVSLASDGLLVLTADRGTGTAVDAIRHDAELEIGRHGAVSFPVSFHALRAWTAARGGVSFRPRPGHRHLHLAGFLFGGDGPSTRAAFDAALGTGTPDVLYSRRRALASASTVDLPALRALIEDAGPDPRVLAECARGLWPHLHAADESLRRDLRTIVLAAWANYFDAGDSDDVPFQLGLLLYAVGAYEDARRLFDASVHVAGDDAATRWNLGLCHLARGRPYAAKAAFERARTLAPGLRPAGLVTVKTLRGARRGSIRY
jgi:hypothetical protein